MKNNPTIYRKAYIVWHEGMLSDNPCERFHSIDEIPVTYADTPSEAKKTAEYLSDYEIEEVPHKYTDIKARRAKNADWLKLSSGEKIRRYDLIRRDQIQKRIAERTDKVNQYPDDACFYVQNGYVGNSVLWWGYKSYGYTTDLTKAELYTKQEILSRFVNGREEDVIWLAKHVLENVRQHVDGQYLSPAHKC